MRGGYIYLHPQRDNGKLNGDQRFPFHILKFVPLGFFGPPIFIRGKAFWGKKFGEKEFLTYFGEGRGLSNYTVFPKGEVFLKNPWGKERLKRLTRIFHQGGENPRGRKKWGPPRGGQEFAQYGGGERQQGEIVLLGGAAQKKIWGGKKSRGV